MFALKNYQRRAIAILKLFLRRCRTGDSVAEAYNKTIKEQGLPPLAYRDQSFKNVPYVCLRIPTGGGKTILASWVIGIAARHYLEVDHPIVLWLVPTNIIRLQTVDALKKPEHPYRAKLDESFQHRVLVLDIDEVNQIRQQDIGGKTIVVVSTLANLRVADTSGRKVYAYREDFEPHFAKVPSNHPKLPLLEKISTNDIQENGLRENQIGNIKYSFANLLALYNPILIVDEAHNARTPLSFETLARVHPKVIIEFTATPDASSKTGSNVLFHASAAELKSEEMIKLPIMLTEHHDWRDAIRDAVITRKKLAIDAQQDEKFIRPIALFQAENKNREVTSEVLKQHLIDELKIDEKKIAIATGSQRELNDVDLFDAQCQIEYIITNEALKEGWDCSFAYVFCSVKKVTSGRSAEQLLGRVLRMPYAKRRVVEDLNRAYAHLATSQFSRAAQQLTDQLIAMGFETMDVATFLKAQFANGQSDVFGDNDFTNDQSKLIDSVVFNLPTMPDIAALCEKERTQISMTQDGDVAIVKMVGNITEDTERAIIKTVKTKTEKEKIKRDILIHNHRVNAAKAPSQKGEAFGKLPLLCVFHQEEIELAEPELFLDIQGWNLLDYKAKIENFEFPKNIPTWEIDSRKSGKMVYGIADQTEIIDLDHGFIDVNEQDLVSWLDRELRQPDVPQMQLMRFVSDCVRNLLRQNNNEYTLTGLVRHKFLLARAIRERINFYRKTAQKKGYQECLFSNLTVCFDEKFVHEFKPDNYPSRTPYYDGRYQFKKHFFAPSRIEDLKGTGEEFECAKAIDMLVEVKYWIRNLTQRGNASFWLPLAHGKFYPDFVCELKDGRMLVVEYKGETYASNDDSAEKRNVGKLWANTSDGKCLFLMAVKKDEDGRNVHQQLSSAIKR